MLKSKTLEVFTASVLFIPKSIDEASKNKTSTHNP